ncbi:Transcription elongation factor, TFIIS/CRSP70, N-terminal, sub-type [Sesbania bispinosa]|nr:Transcription elongation factor, TFIIS/CRSP70, N-terminal, sub-type [Sesbania bispinosa]
MHARVQPGGRSPKPMSSPTSTSQLKSVSDSVQNSTSSFPSHSKGRKRERVDQGSEPVKRERSTKIEDGDSGNFRYDNILKTEISKITEKGGLVDTQGVEKLVQLMVPDRTGKKIDLASRSSLAAVIAATDKFDCLSQFVQLRGLPVLDEWLQEVHKGKVGDGIGSRDGDKSVEEFLLVLLRALDKLPVNLQALQMCNIGKSVNHLRTHKNTEIQRKARGLVDTWKKRVEAEMNINDAKSGSGPTVAWPAKSRLPDVGQGGNRHSGGSSDAAMKSSVTQLSASKIASVKIVQGDNATRSASTSAFPGPAKSVPSPRVAAVSGGSDNLMANARDEKSSSSSHSHNNSQSCSSDHAKIGGLSGKEDARSSTAMSANKVSGGSSRHRKSINGFSGSALSGGQRETGSSRNSSLHKKLTSEKISQSGLMDKTVDETSLEGNTPKLIVKIPNQGRSLVQRASAGSLDDPTIKNSRASSPVLSEKHDQFDHVSNEKSDLYRANIGSDIKTESWQSNDFKDVLTGSDEGDGSPAAVTDEERCRTGDDCKKPLEVSKAASSSSGNENKAGNLQDASYSSINALIEGVKYSEADDVGMNLLASVAAEEILKSNLITPARFPERNTTAIEQLCTGNGVVKSSEENLVRGECQSNNGLDSEQKNQGSMSGDLGMNDDNNSDSRPSVGNAARELNEQINACSMDLQHVTEANLESKGKLNEKPISTPFGGLPESSTVQEARDGDCSEQLKEEAVRGVNAGEILDVKVSGVVGVVEEIEKLPCSAEVNVKGDNCTTEGSSGGGQTAQKPSAILMQSDSARGADENVLHSCVDKVSEDANEREYEKTHDMATENHASQSKKQKNECESNALMMPENKGLCSSATGFAAEHVGENSEMKEVHDQDVGVILNKASSSFRSQEMDKHLDSKGSKLTAMEVEEAEECTSTTADAPSMSAAAALSDADAKIEFDLNEGFNADDGKCGEFNSITTSGCAPAVQLISPVPFPAPSMSCGIPASITVAAAAKGPFVPPEDLLRSKGELGWKGSAATSAFRPAEPRKVLEMPLGTQTTPIPDAAAGKQSRPPLDIDLNVPDERILDDVSSQICARQTDVVSLAADGHEPVCSKTASPVRCSGGLGLDLNQVDEASDVGNCSMSSSHKIDVPLMQVKSSLSGPPSRDMSVHRDFDLNNGPSADEVTTEPSLFSQHARISVPSQPPVFGLRMSTAEPGNSSSWLPSSGNTYSAVTISSIMPDRGDQPFSIVAPNGPQRLLTPATGGNPFGSDIYRGPVLSYPSAPFEYPVFPFNSSFPLPSASFSAGPTTYVYSTPGSRLCFPAVNSQLMGPAGTVSSHYPRPYVVGLPDGSNSSSSAETSRKWARQGLDLNAGPGGSDIEGRDESSSLPSRQLSVACSQAIAEEHARIQLAGSVHKRKEPDSGWDGYKQSSWQ